MYLLFILHFLVVIELQNFLNLNGEKDLQPSECFLEMSLDNPQVHTMKWVELEYYEHHERKERVRTYYRIGK